MLPWWAQLGELILPRSCAGCGAPGDILCTACRCHLQQVPSPIHRPRDLGTRVFALGPYSDIRRSAIIAMKEQNNQAVRDYIGAVFAAGLVYLRARGDIPENFCLVPAPTRPRSARARGGDPVEQWCAYVAKHLPGVSYLPALTLRQQVTDQSRLDAAQRWKNMRDAVQARDIVKHVAGRPVIVLDDVVTTGATLAAAVATLRGAGAVVRGGLVLADA